MPTYAYRCRDCGHELEVHQGFSDAALTECPVCGGTLRKQYGTVGVTFNGSGFYRTDSRAAESSGGKSGGESSGGDSSAARSDAPKADPKPKAESKPAASSTSAS